MTSYRFRLFVMGWESRSRSAEDQLRAICVESLGDDFEIEVVDLSDHPDRADLERIVATPTLDRIEPTPRVRVIGDLASREQLIGALDLPRKAAEPRRDLT